jgi:hypothetical protein
VWHRTVRCASGATATAQQSTPTETCKSATVRAESEQHQKAHRTVNSICPVRHRTVRCPSLIELQRSNPNGWMTWLAHRTVFGGAPECPVHPSTDSLPNDHFGGWGYKYPLTTTLQGIQDFSHCIQYKSSRLHSKTQNKISNPLQVPNSFQRLSGL